MAEDKRYDWSEFKKNASNFDISRVPCARTAYGTGLGFAAVIGTLRFTRTRNFMWAQWQWRGAKAGEKGGKYFAEKWGEAGISFFRQEGHISCSPRFLLGARVALRRMSWKHWLFLLLRFFLLLPFPFLLFFFFSLIIIISRSAGNAAVGSFIVSGIAALEYCRYKHHQGVLQVHRAIQDTLEKQGKHDACHPDASARGGAAAETKWRNENKIKNKEREKEEREEC
jgi:hypothetical protein